MAEGMRVSGVGAKAKRTDLDRARKIQREAKIQNASGGGYGQRAELTSLASGAPMPQGPKAAPVPQLAPRQAMPPIPSVGIFEPTQRPDEPITAGAAGGVGPGPEVLQTPVTAPNQLAVLARAMFAANPTPQLRRLVEAFMQEGQ
jgi:hypothetical protein